MPPTAHETFSSRLGFLMLSAACAIGLGNVWRFPSITGTLGGGAFVAVYLLFLLAVLPVMIAEFAIGRAAQASPGLCFHRLTPNRFWHGLRWFSLLGAFALLMFYTTVSGWMLAYGYLMATGTFAGASLETSRQIFTDLLQNPEAQVLCMTLCVVFCVGVNALGLRRGVERVINLMMGGLFLLLTLLVVRVLFLPGAFEGLRYFLVPSLSRFEAHSFFDICNAAMCQAFFTLGIGIGTMITIASYYHREQSLTGEAVTVALLDTVVAVMAGMLIFPACAAFGIKADSGPALLFITLPHVFNAMPSGEVWGSLFFLFMTFASFSTVIAVVETILAIFMDTFGLRRTTAALLAGPLLWLLSLPCALGWSLLRQVTPLGPGTTILDFEDFLVSNNLLPIGAILFTLFCSLKCGWGWDRFLGETNQGQGLHLPGWFRPYLRFVLPTLLLFVFLAGYVDRFGR